MDIYNSRNRERGKGKTPDELFTQTNSVKPPLTRFHTFGCPVFVLDSNLQDNNKIPRWNPHARQGLFLGFISHHSSSVAWVLNLQTGHISPQYHVVFDDSFTTCDVFHTNRLPYNWDDLYKNKRYEIEFDEDNKWKLDKTWEPLSVSRSIPANKHYTVAEKTR